MKISHATHPTANKHTRIKKKQTKYEKPPAKKTQNLSNLAKVLQRHWPPLRRARLSGGYSAKICKGTLAGLEPLILIFISRLIMPPYVPDRRCRFSREMLIEDCQLSAGGWWVVGGCPGVEVFMWVFESVRVGVLELNSVGDAEICG